MSDTLEEMQQKLESKISNFQEQERILAGIPVKDNVNHPKHYKGKTLEVIDVLEDFKLGYHLGNAVKYILRAGKKNPDHREDLQKAIWYLNRYLENYVSKEGWKEK